MTQATSKASGFYTNEPPLMPIIEAFSGRIGAVTNCMPPEVTKLCAAYALPTRPEALHIFTIRYFPGLRDDVEAAITERADPLRALSVRYWDQTMTDLSMGRISKLVFFRLNISPTAIDLANQAVRNGDANLAYSLLIGRGYRMRQVAGAGTILDPFDRTHFVRAFHYGHFEICDVLVNRAAFGDIVRELWHFVDNLTDGRYANVDDLGERLSKAVAYLCSEDIKRWLRNKDLSLPEQFSILWNSEPEDLSFQSSLRRRMSAIPLYSTVLHMELNGFRIERPPAGGCNVQ